jgi:menaquinone-dependent protoporphyrinogen oxidase
LNLLVAYATVHGSTRGIAERIGARLTDTGHRVDTLPMADVPEAVGYDSFILGSAIHERAWLPEAVHFLEANSSAMAGRPLWLFSVGMPAALGRRWRGFALKEEAVVMAALKEAVEPRGHHLFSGAVYPDHLSLIGRATFRAMGGKYGDFRDRHEIDEWADAIARQLASRWD